MRSFVRLCFFWATVYTQSLFIFAADVYALPTQSLLAFGADVNALLAQSSFVFEADVYASRIYS
jgi:hypothetical protein